MKNSTLYSICHNYKCWYGKWRFPVFCL